ncbi:MAG: hypothetical protein HOF33_05295 [Rhodospirillaceae bacterium]|nr:hypothetical protein [Rhodospirillaceae bacterium]
MQELLNYSERRFRSKDGLMLQKGDVLKIFTSGGAGYGLAAERDPGLVRRDVAEGNLSDAAARAAYPHAF